MRGATFKPIRILEVELSQPLPAVAALDHATGRRYERATALVRLHHQPIGAVDFHLEDEGLDAEDLARQIWRQLGPQIDQHFRQNAPP